MRLRVSSTILTAALLCLAPTASLADLAKEDVPDSVRQAYGPGTMYLADTLLRAPVTLVVMAMLFGASGMSAACYLALQRD